MAIMVERNIKGLNQQYYTKLKTLWGQKGALWCKVCFYHNKDAASDTALNNELDQVEVPFKPSFDDGAPNLWAQAYSEIKNKLTLMGYTVVSDV